MGTANRESTVTPHTVLLLHGWPGLPSDYDAVRERLESVRTVVPDLAGFGDAFEGELPLSEATAESHARRLLGMLDDRSITGGVVIAGYDIGSRIAQAALRLDPSRFDGAVLTPAYPGIGDRAGAQQLAPVFWYQHFHREPVAVKLIDGKPEAVRAYLEYLWSSWSGSSTASAPDMERIVAAYSRPGAFEASIQWYRANRGYAGDLAPIDTPAIMLWPTEDPLFPVEWADRLDEHFTNAALRTVRGSGHFVPIEAPSDFAEAIRSFLTV